MHASMLIELLVQQTARLIAAIATHDGARVPLGDLSDRLFRAVADELGARGLRQKVVADMFGVATRGLQKRLSRIPRSVDHEPLTLWQAVLAFVCREDGCSRADLLRRFCRDDEDILRGVLRDLGESGLITKTGRGAHTRYEPGAGAGFREVTHEQQQEALRGVAQAIIYQEGPLPQAELAARMRVPEAHIVEAIDTLVARRLVNARPDPEDDDPAARLLCTISYGEWVDAEQGWELAFYDHVHAVMSLLARRLDEGRPPPRLADITGASTYTFDLDPDHPAREPIVSLLARARQLAAEARALDEKHAKPFATARRAGERVTFYVGQLVLPLD